MYFRKWLFEVGGDGGVGGGLVPILQRPDLYAGAFADYHANSETNPKSQYGKLPPVRKQKKNIYNQGINKNVNKK
jgi:hypothetical protein